MSECGRYEESGKDNNRVKKLRAIYCKTLFFASVNFSSALLLKFCLWNKRKIKKSLKKGFAV